MGGGGYNFDLEDVMEKDMGLGLRRERAEEPQSERAGQGLGPFQPVEDPWAHRSVGMRCITCMWYVEKEGPGLGNRRVGRCRRHAPTMNGYPVVFVTDWCGDHKLDEAKV